MQQQRGDDDGLQDIIAAARLKTAKPARSSAKQEQRGPVREFFGKCVVRISHSYTPPFDGASVLAAIACPLSDVVHGASNYTLASGIRTAGPNPTFPVLHIQSQMTPWGLARCWALALLCWIC